MFHTYGLFIGIAVVVGYSIAQKLEPEIEKAAAWVIVAGFVGARIYHVIEYWEYYSLHLAQIPMVWKGGMSIWGALIAGGLAMIIYFKGETLKVMGNIVVALPLSQAIGRIANGVNNEFTNLVFGVPWWGAEMFLDLLLFAIIWGLSLRGQSSQAKVGAYIVGYGLIRLVLQPYRL